MKHGLQRPFSSEKFKESHIRMRSLSVAKYSSPDKYEVADLPAPGITSPDQVQIKVHAASINPVDVKLASGLAKLFDTAKFVLQDLIQSNRR